MCRPANNEHSTLSTASSEMYNVVEYAERKRSLKQNSTH